METARTLAFGEVAIWRQWAALLPGVRLTGTAPDQLKHALLDSARASLWSPPAGWATCRSGYRDGASS